MRRLEYYDVHCSQEGCHEFKSYACHSRKEYLETVKEYRTKKWYCSRHRPENLQPTSEPRHVYINCIHPDATKYPRIKDSHIWSDGSGYTFGPGFNAHAEDFPIGTRLHITIAVEIPETEEQKRQRMEQAIFDNFFDEEFD